LTVNLSSSVGAAPGTNVPAELLRRAARALETGEVTWGQGDFITTSGCRCALGTITYAADGIACTDGNPRHITSDALTRINATLAAATLADWITQRLDGIPAYDDGELNIIETVGEWNDRTGRSLDDVIEALTDAADEWDRVAAR
jgi:hypothetical protein